MSEHLRISSPVSSSPGRSAAIARPAWPWQVSSLRSSSSSINSLEHRASYLNTPRSTGSPGIQSNSSSVTCQPATNSRPIGSTMTNTSSTSEDSTRQWSFMGFEWVVRDIHKLRDFVEGVGLTEAENSDFEILRQSPMLGDNRFKLEIAFTPHREGTSDARNKTTLSLYITSLMVDFAQADYELSASIMAAIKCQADRVGERGSPPEWVWDFWQTDWVFRQENEVWECPLPSLSALLDNSRIRETDSLVICVQIHCPSGPSFPQQPSVYSVPRDLLDGLEASLDNSNTGDVRFVCLERLNMETQSSPILDLSNTAAQATQRSMSSSSPSFPTETTARKRVIYAHSDILIRRSDYFATMLASSFSENPAIMTGERKVYTIVVEEADFETIYWLLKFCYANWLLFREHDDPRTAMDGISIGWSTKWSQSQGGEWDWKTLHKDDGTSDTRSVTSNESLLSASGSGLSTVRSETTQRSTTSLTASPSGSKTITSIPKPTMNPSSPSNPPSTRRTIPPSSSTILSTSGSNMSPNTISRTKDVPVPVTTNYATSAHSGYPSSPRANRQQMFSIISSPDPHPHPTPAPKPASALSMYRAAHRYAMPGLAALALEHMMTTITPQSSFALLLATSVWDELRLLIEDYIIEKWDEVSISEEFEQCCQEVAAGEWGSDGGKTLMSIFRRLRAPNTMV